jgi:hypothetical protein
MVVISDIEWEEFVNDNIVSDDMVEIIAIRIMINSDLTKRELSIYAEHSVRIESKLNDIKHDHKTC